MKNLTPRQQTNLFRLPTKNRKLSARQKAEQERGWKAFLKECRDSLRR